MKKLKKIFIGLFALTLTIGLAACGSDESTSKDSITILSLKPEMDAGFQAYVKRYSTDNNVDVKVITCGGDSCDFEAKLDALSAAGDMPDIFVLEGKGGFATYSDAVLDLSNESWASDTNYAFVDGGKTYGYPVAVEGFGLTYNKDILDKAGIDPMSLTSYDAYKTAFATLTSMKDELGIVAPVSMAVGPGMHWVSGNHQFNSYLSAGLETGDSSVLDDLNSGMVDAARLSDYADWTELLYANSDANVLNQAGDAYADNVKLFTDGKTAFVHQGNWIEGDVETAGLTNVGIAPTGDGDNPTPFLGAPSYFFVSKDGNTDLAKKFLMDLHDTTEGQDFLFKDQGFISPFQSIQVVPEKPLAESLYNWAQAGTTAGWNQNDMPAGYGQDTLGPIHELYANGTITKAQFVEQITAAIEGLK